MAEPVQAAALLQEAEFEQVMLLVDGELTGAERTAAETLVAQSAEAGALFAALTETKLALRQAVVTAPISTTVNAELNRVRDNVLHQTVLSATAVPRVVQEPSLVARLFGWLEERSPLGKLSLAAGAAVAVALWMVVAADRAPSPEAPAMVANGPAGADTESVASAGTMTGAVASLQGDGMAADPQAIFGEIEELEIESGSVLVSPADSEGSTVIWHFAEGQPG